MNASASLAYQVALSDHARSDDQRAAILAGELGFCKYFTDHMVAIQWDKAQGWHDAQVRAYGPLALDPAAGVLHYGQEIFEGIKAYRHADGSIWTTARSGPSVRMPMARACSDPPRALRCRNCRSPNSWSRCASSSPSTTRGCRRRRKAACISVPS